MMKGIDILLVEDNEGDILLTAEALEESKLVNEIITVRDGQSAIDFFESLPNNKGIPQLVLLDINLPKVNGHEVLSYLKSNKWYKRIPVIMLTTSSSEKDIQKCYENHVDGYITKPIEVSDFIKAIEQIEDFWINMISIPGK